MNRLNLTVAAAVLALTSGCAGRYYWHSRANYGYTAYPTAPAQVVVYQPPPPVPVVTELRPPPPSPSHVWVDGHWTYNGMWVWVDGSWVSGYAGWIWTPPVMVVVDGQYVLYRGYFRQPRYQPAPQYTHPHRVEISAGARLAGRVQDSHQPPPQPPPPQQPQVDRPRQLEVPGGMVRTPPAPPPGPDHPRVVVTPGGSVRVPPEPPPQQPRPTPVAPPPADRPVLVTPGGPATHPPSRVPNDTQPAPNAPPPVLSNVPPVQERPVDPGKGHGQVMPPPSNPPTVTTAPGRPTQVAPSGPATLPSRRAQPQPAPQTMPNQSRSTNQPGTVLHPSPQVMQVQPSRSAPPPTSTQRAEPRRPSSGGFSNTMRSMGNRPAPAPSTSSPRSKPSTPTVVRPSGGATRSVGRSRKDPTEQPAKKPSAITCTLMASEAPRGGQLDIQGQGFGATPVVRIGGRATRILRRNATEIRIQIPRDSNGGSVTVQAAGESAECGTLTIIGTNR